jgi:signal transduction histidine kinase
LAGKPPRAAASHRRTAEKTLRDYAAIAAWEYAREGRIWLSFGMADAEDMISREIPRRKGPLPGTDLLRQVLKQKECDCMSAGFARTVFRIVAGAPPELEVDGEALSDAARAGILNLLVHDSVPPRGPRRWRMLPPGVPSLNRPDDTILLWKAPAKNRRIRLAPSMAWWSRRRRSTVPLLGAAGDATLPASIADRRSPLAHDRERARSLGRHDLRERHRDGSRVCRHRHARLALRESFRPGRHSRPRRLRPCWWAVCPAVALPQIGVLLGLTLVLGTGALLLLRREQQLARLRDDFVSSVSHELRTPLTQIRVMGELLADKGFKSAPEEERAREVIRREALRLTNLVDNVLQFARMRRGPQALAARTLPLGEVITEACEALLPLSSSRRVTLDVQLRDDIRVMGDRDAVVQILRNLLENAIKYGPEGQTVRLAAEAGRGGEARSGGPGSGGSRRRAGANLAAVPSARPRPEGRGSRHRVGSLGGC